MLWRCGRAEVRVLGAAGALGGAGAGEQQRGQDRLGVGSPEAGARCQATGDRLRQQHHSQRLLLPRRRAPLGCTRSLQET